MQTQRQWRGSWFSATDRAYIIEQLLPTPRGFYRDLLPGERALGNFILPSFQRPSVWTLDQQVRLIESLLDELPVPPYVVNRDLDDGYLYDRWLVDGQQRITAILGFVNTLGPKGPSVFTFDVVETPGFRVGAQSIEEGRQVTTKDIHVHAYRK